MPTSTGNIIYKEVQESLKLDHITNKVIRKKWRRGKYVRKNWKEKSGMIWTCIKDRRWKMAKIIVNGNQTAEGNESRPNMKIKYGNGGTAEGTSDWRCKGWRCIVDELWLHGTGRWQELYIPEYRLLLLLLFLLKKEKFLPKPGF